MWTIEHRIDFKKFGAKPVQRVIKLQEHLILRSDLVSKAWLNIRVNEIETQDDPIQVFYPYEWEDGFIDIESYRKDIVGPQPSWINGNVLYYQQWIMISSESISRSRRIYSLLDLFGDFGGVKECFMLCASFFIASWAEFKFNLKAI